MWAAKTVLVVMAFFLVNEITCRPSVRDTCPCTPQYEPVCGSNGVSYFNECHFRCAKNRAIKNHGPALAIVLYQRCCISEEYCLNNGLLTNGHEAK